MNTKYICQHHVKQISNNPFQATIQLNKLRSMGRESLELRQWKRAITLYGTAYEMAAILLFSKPIEDSGRAKLFLHTAIEYGFALRKSQLDVDMAGFVALVRNQLLQLETELNIEKYLSPVQDIAFLPMPEVEYLMLMFFNVQQSKAKTIH